MIDRTQESYKDLELLSKQGVLGKVIPEHRALLRSSFSSLKWLTIAFFPILFDYIIVKSVSFVGQFWLMLFNFWFEKIEIPGKVMLVTTKLAGFEIELPAFFVHSSAPDATNWWLLVLIVVGLVSLIYILPKRFLPLFYIFGFISLVLLSSLIYFAVMPARFSYTASGYLDNLLMSGVWLLLVMPWVHGLIYYIFDFSVQKKIFLTVATLIFIVVALPFQLITQTILLLKFSVIILPVLYVFFGLFLLIICCLSLYGWAMSWERNAQ